MHTHWARGPGSPESSKFYSDMAGKLLTFYTLQGTVALSDVMKSSILKGMDSFLLVTPCPQPTRIGNTCSMTGQAIEHGKPHTAVCNHDTLA